MMKIKTIALREFKNFFISPLGWIVLAATQGIISFQYIARIADYIFDFQPKLVKLSNPPGVTDLVGVHTIANVAELLLVIMPIITMHAFSAERRDHSLTLLRSSPISITEMVLGKYLGILGFSLLIVLQVAVMIFTLELGTDLDIGKVLSGLIGLSLVIAAWTAAGIYFSSLTKSPATAAIVTIGLLMILWKLEWGAETSQHVAAFFAYLSVPNHFGPMVMGIIQSVDVCYFILFIALFLTLTIRRFDAERLRH